MDLKTYCASVERGEAARLAAAMGVSPSFLSQMASGKAAINTERCVQIEQLTKGKVTRKDLRPETWEQSWPELATPHQETGEAA